MRLVKPPLGVMPFRLWVECVGPMPDLKEWVDRFRILCDAIGECRAAGADVPMEWLVEAGLWEVA